MNRVVLIGRLTKDVQLRYTSNGTAVASFTLAVNRRFKSNEGPDADFIPIVVWRNQAENVEKYVGKGSQVGVAGRIQTRNYQAKDGTTRYITEVVADEVEFIGTKKNNMRRDDNELNQDFGVPLDDFHPVEDDDDDLPF